MNLKTKTLQDMVTKSIKCVTNNKLIPLTSLISLSVKDNVFMLTTTDATNYFYVSYPDKVDNEDIEFSVLADLFVKLIQKITTENVELNLDVNSGVLTIKGNGNYTLELPLDENGNLIKFPKKYDDTMNDFGNIIKRSSVNKIINYNKSSLAVSVELPALTAYYCGDSVITSDSFKICSTGIKLFNSPMLITMQLMELLGIMSNEDITYCIKDNAIIFKTAYDTVYAPIMEGVDSYPITPINTLIDSEFEASCKLSKTALLDVLDRVSLFVTSYDKKAIYMTFTKDGLLISSKKSSGVELIPYIESENFKEYTCCIDFEMLKSQVVTASSDTINLYYGSKIAVKIVDDNIIQIVALAQDDRVDKGV